MPVKVEEVRAPAQPLEVMLLLLLLLLLLLSLRQRN